MHYHVEYRNNTDQNFEPLSTASVNSREILPWEGDVVKKVYNYEDLVVFPCYQPVSNS